MFYSHIKMVFCTCLYRYRRKKNSPVYNFEGFTSSSCCCSFLCIYTTSHYCFTLSYVVTFTCLMFLYIVVQLVSFGLSFLMYYFHKRLRHTTDDYRSLVTTQLTLVMCSVLQFVGTILLHLEKCK